MERLTTDTPNGNFETLLNFVHGKDGWAHIYDEDGKEINLITWALNHCHDRGCDDFQCETLEEYDEALSSCMMDYMDCPIAMAYCFASQAVHMRSRLKMYEDAIPLARVQELAQAEKDGRLVVLPCKNDTVYTIEEDYFNCDKCRHGDRAYYQAKIDRISCDMNNGVHCPLYVEAHEVDGFEVKFDTFGAVILSGPGEFGYEGLEQFSGIAGKVYYTREEAEAALKKREEIDI